MHSMHTIRPLQGLTARTSAGRLCPPPPRCRRMPTLRHTQHSKVVGSHLAGRAHQEVRGDQTTGASKLPLAAVDVPGHGPLLASWVGTGTEVPRPDRAKGEPMPSLPKGDAAGLLEGRFPRESQLRRKGRLATPVGCSVPCTPAAPMVVVMVQLAARVMTWNACGEAPTGAAYPLNCMVYRNWCMPQCLSTCQARRRWPYGAPPATSAPGCPRQNDTAWRRGRLDNCRVFVVYLSCIFRV